MGKLGKGDLGETPTTFSLVPGAAESPARYLHLRAICHSAIRLPGGGGAGRGAGRARRPRPYRIRTDGGVDAAWRFGEAGDPGTGSVHRASGRGQRGERPPGATIGLDSGHLGMRPPPGHPEQCPLGLLQRGSSTLETDKCGVSKVRQGCVWGCRAGWVTVAAVDLGDLHPVRECPGARGSRVRAVPWRKETTPGCVRACVRAGAGGCALGTSFRFFFPKKRMFNVWS